MKTFILIALAIGLLVIGWVFARVAWALLPFIVLTVIIWWVYDKYFAKHFTQERRDDHDHS